MESSSTSPSNKFEHSPTSTEESREKIRKAQRILRRLTNTSDSELTFSSFGSDDTTIDLNSTIDTKGRERNLTEQQFDEAVV